MNTHISIEESTKKPISFEQRDFFENLGFWQCELLIEGNPIRFTPTKAIVSTTPSGKTFRISHDLHQLVSLKANGGLFDYIHPEIVKKFSDVVFSDTQAVTGRIQIFKNEIMWHKIMDEGRDLHIFKNYGIGHALLLANEIIKQDMFLGESKEETCAVIIFLKETYQERLHYLSVDKDLNDRYCIGLGTPTQHSHNRDSPYDIGNGVLFAE